MPMLPLITRPATKSVYLAHYDTQDGLTELVWFDKNTDAFSQVHKELCNDYQWMLNLCDTIVYL